MKLFILISGIVALLWLAAEKRSAVGHRRALRHVIHVNGTRGKSAVTRLIAAGLSAGGFRVFCKTTGTVPMTIDPEGREQVLHRRGKANIKEQIAMLRQAARSGAEVLVIECMAVDPELQWVCEHRILHSDLSVITNARVDHVAEMGSSTSEVCRALCGTIPENGIVFTAEKDCFDQIEQAAREQGSHAVLAEAPEEIPEGELFPENIALALAVCREAGVEESIALEGMRKVRKDPYAVSCSRLKGGALLLNGMAANDPQSTALLLRRFLEQSGESIQKKVLLLNCRADRGYRTELMIRLILELRPDAVWLMGSGSRAAAGRLRRKRTEVQVFASADKLPLDDQTGGTLIYAIGNIAGEGIRLMDRAGKEGSEFVW